jgi:hypothetical protein
MSKKHREYQEILDKNAVELIELLIYRAKEEGSMTALKMCIERILPVQKSIKATLNVKEEDLSSIDRVKDVALQSLLRTANGEMENEQANSISKLIDTYVGIDLTPDSLYARLQKAKDILPGSGDKK